MCRYRCIHMKVKVLCTRREAAEPSHHIYPVESLYSKKSLVLHRSLFFSFDIVQHFAIAILVLNRSI
jgi:hypothetical protein